MLTNIPNILNISNISNIPKYQFENINDNDKIIKLEKKKKNLEELLKKKNKFKKTDAVYGQIFDVNIFNARVEEVNEITREKNKIIDEIKLSRLNYKPPDAGKLTITQLNQGLLLDTYNMFKEFSNLKEVKYININNILNKNYRRLTLLIILFVIFITSYILIKFLSD